MSEPWGIASELALRRGEAIPIGEIHLVRDMQWRQQLVLRTKMSPREIAIACSTLARGLLDQNYPEDK